jgi:DNA-binding SARP family transcriptional activator
MWVGILGPLAVRHDDTEITIPGARQRVLLGTLAVQANHPVSLDELTGAVWGAMPTSGAHATLRTYLMRLRQTLGPRLGTRVVTREPGYMIQLAEGELDLSEFESLLKEGGRAIHERAWQRASHLLAKTTALWRGTPLADMPSEALQHSIVPRLEQMHLQAVEWLNEADLNLGRHGRLVPELQAMAMAHPLCERFHAQLMIALYRCGRQAEALDAYQRARGRLVDELGVEPGGELRQLHQRILRADPALDWRGHDNAVRVARPPAIPGDLAAGLPSDDGTESSPGRYAALAAAPVPRGPTPAAPMAPVAPVPQQLPATTRHFTGRARELALLTELLEQPYEARATVISGTGGVGKTALAVHWAEEIAHRFPDGQLFADLRGFDPSSTPVAADEAIRGFLIALGITADGIPPRADAQAALYRSLLADKRVLVVLDNARDARQVRPLLPGGRGCFSVVTSRSHLVELAVTDGAELLTLDMFSPDESREMLISRLGTARATAEPAAIAEVSTLCSGLPLALSIAAARAVARPGFPLATLAAEFDSGGLLDALDADGGDVSVRAVLSWSYRQLSCPAARMYRLLGLHAGPDISGPAAASLAGLSRGQAAAALTELTCAHLLTEHAHGRFALHGLLRAYATELAHALDSDTQRRGAVHRILDHYLTTCYQASRLLRPIREPIAVPAPAADVTPEDIGDCRQAMTWFEGERDVLLAVLALAADAGFDVHARQLARAMVPFFRRRSCLHGRDEHIS